MNYYLQKQKIPRTHRFPVRRSRLDAALVAAGIEQLDSVNFSFRPKWVPDQLLVVATYKPEGVTGFYAMPESHGVVPFHAGTTSVTVYALPRSEAPLAEQLLQEHGLSRLGAWLAKQSIKTRCGDRTATISVWTCRTGRSRQPR